MATHWDTSEGGPAGGPKNIIEPSVARILDANANRAREALRVMEDYVRFALNDRALTERVKMLRHDLSGLFIAAPWADVVRARDVCGDEGREVGTEAEYRREDARHVASAAAKRCSEALRSLEEFTKTFDVDRARELEALRYRVYEIERAVAIRNGADRMAAVELYVLLTESLCKRDWNETARLAIEGGADCIQLREKGLSDGVLLERARRLAELCHRSDVMFIVNDRPDIAVLAGADGVHVGQDDVSVAQARRIVGPSMLVGASTHTIEQARAAMENSPDYIAVGPMFQSETKPQPHVPGPSLLTTVQAETSLPIVPIGGIGPENVRMLTEAGARRVCVCSAVIGATDVAGAARDIKQALRRNTHNDAHSRCTSSRP